MNPVFAPVACSDTPTRLPFPVSLPHSSGPLLQTGAGVSIPFVTPTKSPAFPASPAQRFLINLPLRLTPNALHPALDPSSLFSPLHYTPSPILHFSLAHHTAALCPPCLPWDCIHTRTVSTPASSSPISSLVCALTRFSLLSLAGPADGLKCFFPVLLLLSCPF